MEDRRTRARSPPDLPEAEWAENCRGWARIRGSERRIEVAEGEIDQESDEQSIGRGNLRSGGCLYKGPSLPPGASHIDSASMSAEATFTSEGGKYLLAEALFSQHRYQIRCPTCQGTAQAPGFIKDQAGKSTKDGLNRRMWKCQQSNGRNSTTSCPRQTCTQFIHEARQTLDASQFQPVVRQVLQQAPHPGDVEALRTYLSPPPPALPVKRKALADLPNPRGDRPPPALHGPKTPGPRSRLPAQDWLPQAITVIQEQQRLLRQILQTIEPAAPPPCPSPPDEEIGVSSSPDPQVPSSAPTEEVASSSLPNPKTPEAKPDLPTLVARFCQASSAHDRRQIREQCRLAGSGKREFETLLQARRKPPPVTPPTPTPDASEG